MNKLASPQQKQAEHRAQFEAMTATESEPLLVVNTVFPFTLFPNSIEVYTEKVVINYRTFFFSRRVFPVIIRDLISVTADTNLIFGAVRFEITFSEVDPETVSFLWRSDALRVRRLVTGLMAAQKRGIELSSLSHAEVLEHLERLGQSSNNRRSS